MKKRVEFLNKLFDLLRCREEILQFLKDEKLITDDVMQHILHDHHTQHATRIAGLLADLNTKEELQLVDYTWTILPKELLQLVLISKSTRKEFTYSV